MISLTSSLNNNTQASVQPSPFSKSVADNASTPLKPHENELSINKFIQPAPIADLSKALNTDTPKIPTPPTFTPSTSAVQAPIEKPQFDAPAVQAPIEKPQFDALAV